MKTPLASKKLGIIPVILFCLASLLIGAGITFWTFYPKEPRYCISPTTLSMESTRQANECDAYNRKEKERYELAKKYYFNKWR
jgi:hypothetical protein